MKEKNQFSVLHKLKVINPMIWNSIRKKNYVFSKKQVSTRLNNEDHPELY